MKKNEFVALIAEKSGGSKKDAESYLQYVTDAITEVLEAGDKIALAGFGTFSVSERAARKGHNPSTGAEIDIPARNVPTFKAATALKDAVNK